MSRIYDGFSDLVGNTPLVALSRLQGEDQPAARILAKIEYLNPAGSIKDRTAWGIIREAELSGRIRPGDLLVDLTSGNTGIGLAAVAAARGYRTKFYLRDAISADKINILRQLGAELVLIKNEELLDNDALQAWLKRMVAENPDAYYTSQRANPANPAVHFSTTGPEIWQDSGGAVDIFVSCVGTGGTISGAGKYLKQQNPQLQVVLVEPTEESVPSPENPGAPSIEGVHRVTDAPPGYLPENFDDTIADEIIAVTTNAARRAALDLARREGFFVGTSSGAAIAAARQVAGRSENHGKTIVVILPDSGERYLSLFDAPLDPD